MLLILSSACPQLLPFPTFDPKPENFCTEMVIPLLDSMISLWPCYFGPSPAFSDNDLLLQISSHSQFLSFYSSHPPFLCPPSLLHNLPLPAFPLGNGPWCPHFPTLTPQQSFSTPWFPVDTGSRVGFVSFTGTFYESISNFLTSDFYSQLTHFKLV